MPILGGDARHLLVIDGLDAGFAGEELDQLTALLVEHPAQEAGAALDPGGGQVGVAEALGQLVGDEAAANHRGRLRGMHLLDDGVCVIQGLEAVDAVLNLVGAWRRVGVGAAAGADHQLVVRELAPAIQVEHLGGRVQGGGEGFEAQVDTPLLVLLNRAEDDTLAGQALEVAGQRDPVVQGVGLEPEQRHRAARVGRLEGLGAGGAGDSVADDHVPRSHKPVV